jgi:tetratricopeptide (TPR) repeat protein
LLAVYKWQFELQINTTRFSSYMVDVLAHTIAPLHDIAVESAWQKVLAAYMAELAKVANPLAQQWAIFLAKLAKATPQRARTDFVLQKLETIYKKACSSKGEVVIEWFTRLLFELYESLDRLPECIDWIQPIIYQNEYNLKLIGLLTEAGNYQRAEALCLRIIKANYQEEYNLPYLICLKKIYAMQPDKRSKLHEIILKIFPLHCTLADYKMIVEEHFMGQPEEAQKWKNKVLRKLGEGAYRSKETAQMYWEVCVQDGKFTTMFNHMERSTLGYLLPAYFDVLYQYDKMKFLLKLSTLSMRTSLEPEEIEGYTLLAQKIYEHYHYMERSIFLKADRSFYGSNFVPFCERIWQENV